MNRIVKIEGKKSRNWSGFFRYKNCNEDLAPYWLSNGMVYTGLTKELAEELGKKLNLNLDPTSDFWKDYKVRMTSKPMLLDLQDPKQELDYHFLKSHKDVAASETDMKPSARYVIRDEASEAKKQNDVIKIKMKAFKAYDEMTHALKLQALRLYGESATSTDPEVVSSRLYEHVNEDPQKFLTLWVDNPNRDVEAFIFEAISRNIIRKQRNNFMYNSDIIGRSLEDAVDFLKNLEHQDIKLAILKQIETIKKIKE